MKINRIVSILLAVVMVFGLFAVTVSAEEPKFSDIEEGYWAEDIINEWADRGVVIGYKDGTFKPDNFITRAEYAQIIQRLLALEEKGDKSFSDVTEDAWYYDAIMCVSNVGIMIGKGDPFCPDEYITREEAFLAYARLIGVGEEDGEADLSMFTDGADVSEWAAGRITALAKEGIVKGYPDGTLLPKNNITRAEILALLSQTKNHDHIHYFNGEGGECSICHRDEENAMKFYLGVTSGEAAVELNVYNDYSAVVTVPAKEVDASKLSVTVKMQNVATLGVSGLRQHTIEIADTGLTGNPSLADWLSNAFTFESGAVKATIDGKECLYEIKGDKNAELATLTATSDNIIATRDAWKALTSHVTASSQEADDSFILIVNGSCLRIGTELLCFEKEEDLKLDNFSDVAALVKNIRDHVKLTTAEAGDWQIEALLKAGTTLAISNSIAVLNDDAAIKVKGLPADTLATLLSEARGAKSNFELASLLMKAVNEVIGAVNGTTEEAPVEVEISFVTAE